MGAGGRERGGDGLRGGGEQGVRVWSSPLIEPVDERIPLPALHSHQLLRLTSSIATCTKQHI